VVRIAKIAGLKMCRPIASNSARLHLGNADKSVWSRRQLSSGHSHVPAALLRRVHEAKLATAPTVTVWGTGTPLREFLYVDDMADACVFLLKHYSESEPINIGIGDEMSISDFAAVVAEAVGYRGKLCSTSRNRRNAAQAARLLAPAWRSAGSPRRRCATDCRKRCRTF